ncbi:hypothetical protein HYH03_005712 [Edaphochlamys debaryana]|uniref:Uncharacterized protein n=1 Tax=Edaphochlamys debaryana TaxID=47281 RepID=A0A835Y6M3_9CHLO|nr:hypothetical protein HYH03_005712 [Edaphochlamys debaryana]|eukprot:KAG2496109.1 hypothetical protein HYH03_005712 [Edaphochlamys debaryana]
MPKPRFRPEPAGGGFRLRIKLVDHDPPVTITPPHVECAGQQLSGDVWPAWTRQALLVVTEYCAALALFVEWTITQAPEVASLLGPHVGVIAAAVQSFIRGEQMALPADGYARAAYDVWAAFTHRYFNGVEVPWSAEPRAPPKPEELADKAAWWLARLVGSGGWQLGGRVHTANSSWVASMRQRLGLTPDLTAAGWAAANPRCAAPDWCLSDSPETDFLPMFPFRFTNGNDNRCELPEHKERKSRFFPGGCAVPPDSTRYRNCALELLACSDALCAFKAAASSLRPEAKAAAAKVFYDEVLTVAEGGPLSDAPYLPHLTACVLGWEAALPLAARWAATAQQLAKAAGVGECVGPLPGDALSLGPPQPMPYGAPAGAGVMAPGAAAPGLGPAQPMPHGAPAEAGAGAPGAAPPGLVPPLPLPYGAPAGTGVMTPDAGPPGLGPAPHMLGESPALAGMAAAAGWALPAGAAPPLPLRGLELQWAGQGALEAQGPPPLPQGAQQQGAAIQAEVAPSPHGGSAEGSQPDTSLGRLYDAMCSWDPDMRLGPLPSRDFEDSLVRILREEPSGSAGVMGPRGLAFGAVLGPGVGDGGGGLQGGSQDASMHDASTGLALLSLSADTGPRLQPGSSSPGTSTAAAAGTSNGARSSAAGTAAAAAGAATDGGVAAFALQVAELARMGLALERGRPGLLTQAHPRLWAVTTAARDAAAEPLAALAAGGEPAPAGPAQAVPSPSGQQPACIVLPPPPRTSGGAHDAHGDWPGPELRPRGGDAGEGAPVPEAAASAGRRGVWGCVAVTKPEPPAGAEGPGARPGGVRRGGS